MHEFTYRVLSIYTSRNNIHMLIVVGNYCTLVTLAMKKVTTNAQLQIVRVIPFLTQVKLQLPLMMGIIRLREQRGYMRSFAIRFKRPEHHTKYLGWSEDEQSPVIRGCR